MKIGFYKDTLANNRGADMAVRNLATGLSSRGHDVTLFEKDAFLEKIKIRYDVLIAAGTNEILDLMDVDGVSPIVLQFHTDPAYQFRHWIRKWRRNRAIKMAMRKCVAVQTLREEYVPFVKRIVPDIPVSVIGNWSSFCDESEIPSGTTVSASHDVGVMPTIIYPAAVNKDKNQRLLVAAFKSLRSEFPEWRLELYGKGTENGFCDLREAYSRCSIMAFPSKTEGFPLSLVDAAAFGKPSVVIRDWIGTCAVGGGVVTMPTVRAFAAGLRTLMSDDNLRRKMGEVARAYCAQRYARDRILDQWEALLQRAARRLVSGI